MRIPRFFQTDTFIVDQTVELSNHNYRHAIQVLRLKVDSPLVLFNGEGGEYDARLIQITKKKALVTIEHFNPIERESPLSLTLALALIKPEKWEYALQKAVELGVTQIQPLITERSVIRLKANQLKKKHQRWQSIITSAAEQSGRTRLPYLHMPLRLNDYLLTETAETTANTLLRISMLPNATQSFTDFSVQSIVPNTTVQLLIGPEGGFTSAEESLLQQNGTIALNAGSRILRAETAALVGLTLLQAKWGDW